VGTRTFASSGGQPAGLRSRSLPETFQDELRAICQGDHGSSASPLGQSFLPTPPETHSMNDGRAYSHAALLFYCLSCRGLLALQAGVMYYGQGEVAFVT
jgi:hypothetical protein